MTDWQYLDAARRGDQAAWRVLFRRYYPLLVRMTGTMIGSYDTGSDLAQETFVRLLTSTIKHREGSFKGFLTTTAYRLALKESRRRQKVSSDVAEEPESSGLSPLDAAIRNETEATVHHVIHSLPREQRDVFALRFVAGHSYGEIADMVGIPIGTVKSRLFYAVKTCREHLKQKGVFA